MRSLKIYMLTSAVVACAISCTEEAAPDYGRPVKVESVTMCARNFDIADPETKTSLTIAETGAEFSWSADDIVGVFPDIMEASQVKFPIRDGNVSEGEATSSANFTGNGWAVMEANKYMSYYPFKPDMNLNMSAIPVIYTGQSQVGNNNTARICLYDYMAAAPTRPSLNGHIGFDFKHMNSLLVLDLTVPKPGKYTDLTLTCDDVPFVTEGVLDITSDNPAVRGTVTDRSLGLSLGGIDIKTAGETLRAFMMLAPMDAVGKTIQVRLQGPNADFVTSFTGRNFVAGRAYKPSVDAVKGGDVIQLETGPKFNVDIKTLVNGETFIYDKNDYKIKNVVFQANADGSVPSLPYVDVSAESSSKPIYASWEESTGTVYVSSPSYKVYANENANGMFNNLRCLSSVSLDEMATIFTKYMTGMFSNCERMTAVDISSFELTNVEDAGNLFSGCRSLAEIRWPDMTFRKSGVSLGGMFSDCEQLSHIDLHCSDGCMVTNMSYAFGGCKNLSDIDLSKMDFSLCGGYTGVFVNCSSIKKLDVSNFCWKNVNGECVWPFEGCTSLEEINLGDFYIPKAERVEEFFRGCRSLRKIDYTRFDVNVKALAHFFLGCSSLESVDVSHFITDYTVSAEGVFSGCSSLTKIDVGNWNTSSFNICNELFSGCSKLESIDISSFETYNVTSMSGLFSGCSSLKKIVLGEGFNTEKVTDMGNFFNGCESLESIDLSRFSTSKVLRFGGMFSGCKSLKEINFGDKFDTHYAESFGAMFSGCASLENLDLSFFNMSSSRNVSGMFFGCTNLKSLNISSFTTEHVENGIIDSMFMGCRNLSELRMGNLFNPVNFCQTFGDVAADIDGKCTIYCSETFLRNFSKDGYFKWCFDPMRATWINCSTGSVMTCSEN